MPFSLSSNHTSNHCTLADFLHEILLDLNWWTKRGQSDEKKLNMLRNGETFSNAVRRALSSCEEIEIHLKNYFWAAIHKAFEIIGLNKIMRDFYLYLSSASAKAFSLKKRQCVLLKACHLYFTASREVTFREWTYQSDLNDKWQKRRPFQWAVLLHSRAKSNMATVR